MVSQLGKNADVIATIGSLEYLAHESAHEKFYSAKGEKDAPKLMKENTPPAHTNNRLHKKNIFLNQKLL